MVEILRPLIEALVDDPKALQVSEVELSPGGRVAIVIRAAAHDVGKIVGKNGANAAALRTLLRALSGKRRRPYMLEIVSNLTKPQR